MRLLRLVTLPFRFAWTIVRVSYRVHLAIGRVLLVVSGETWQPIHRAAERPSTAWRAR